MLFSVAVLRSVNKNEYDTCCHPLTFFCEMSAKISHVWYIEIIKLCIQMSAVMVKSRLRNVAACDAYRRQQPCHDANDIDLESDVAAVPRTACGMLNEVSLQRALVKFCKRFCIKYVSGSSHTEPSSFCQELQC
jgi:hypothetical protein